MSNTVKGVVSSTLGLAVFVVLVFGPAGTWHYWQGWVFLAVFAVATWVPTGYLQRTNPAALERRMHAGPLAEKRPIQKLISAVVFVAFAGSIALSAADHRYDWSNVPVAVCVLGNVLVAIGLGLTMLVVVQNGYAAANVVVEPGQPVVSTGLYASVRHPMYSGALIMSVGVPLALGSYWGLVFLVPALAALILRIRDEEALLVAELPGYAQYRSTVRHRLIPGVW